MIFSYAEQAKLISDRYRDQPLTPLETAKHWVNHVAKNKGAPHLRSVAVDQPFYVLYNLDVWAFLISVIAIMMLLFITTVRVLVSIVLPADAKKTVARKDRSKRKTKKA